MADSCETINHLSPIFLSTTTFTPKAFVPELGGFITGDGVGEIFGMTAGSDFNGVDAKTCINSPLKISFDFRSALDHSINVVLGEVVGTVVVKRRNLICISAVV